MQNTLEVRHVSVSIERSPDDVYRFAAKLENWSQWASGLGKAAKKVGGEWIVGGPLGEVKVRAQLRVRGVVAALANCGIRAHDFNT